MLLTLLQKKFYIEQTTYIQASVFLVGFDYNICSYNTLKMKKIIALDLKSFFITLIHLGAQIRDTQTWYTIVNFGLNQPLAKQKN